MTDIAHGYYWFADDDGYSVAIGWRAASASGVIFRRAGEVISRLALTR